MDGLSIALAIAKALPWTMALTLAAFVLGGVIAVFLCMLRLSKIKLLSYSSAVVILLLRSIPPIVWLFVMFFVFSQYLVQIPPFTAAVISLALITSAYMAEIYRGALKAISQGQYQASMAMGFNTFQKYLHIIAPQAFRHSIPAASSYAIGLLKDTSIASVIGVPEIAKISGQISQKTFDNISVYLIAALFYFTLSLLIAWFSRALDTHLHKRIGA